MNVYNKRAKGVPADAVYVGRPSKWGNPFTHLASSLATYRVAARDEAVAKYRAWLLASPEMIALARKELRGKSLVCWCAPAACHADVLMEVANG